MSLRINAAELNAIKALGVAQLTVARLGSFDGRDEIVKNTKRGKKVWWTTIRGRYRLDANKKYAVELDGDKAGELRFKKGGRKNGTQFANLSDDQRAVPAPSVVASVTAAAANTCNDVVKAMNDAFAKAGINLQVTPK